ncbi:MAG: hypothetical protein U0R76_08915 [Candidatus Nanopelagicales bacterium]
MVAWRGLIPMADLPERLQGRSLGWTWIGPGGHAVNYPLHNREYMNFVATIEGKTWTAETGNGWAPSRSASPTSRVGTTTSTPSSARHRRLLKWALVRRDPIQQWSQGRVSLLGDACRDAAVPRAGRRALDRDGLVLARALASYGDPVELSRYEAARLERTNRMVRGATANTDQFHSQELASPDTAYRLPQARVVGGAHRRPLRLAVRLRRRHRADLTTIMVLPRRGSTSRR